MTISEALRTLLSTGIIVLLGILPWCPSALLHLHPHDLARLGQVMLLGVAACCAALVHQRTAHVAATRLLTLLVGGVLPVAAAPNVTWALREWALVTGLCALAGLIACAPLSKVRGLVAGVALTFGLYGLALLVLLCAVGAQHPDILRADVIPGYGNHRFFNHVQTALIPVVALGAYQTRSVLERRFLWACFASHIVLLLFTGGRATMLSLAVAGGAAFSASSAPLRRRSLSVLVASLSGMAVYVCLFVLSPAWFGYSPAETLHQRLATVHTMASRWDAWQLAWQDIVTHPLLGIGPMHFASHAESPIAHPHNLFLQLFAEWGVVFSLAAVVLMCWGLYALFKQLRAMPSEGVNEMMGPLLVWSCAAAFLDAFFSGNAVMPNSQVAIAMCAGAAGAWYGQYRQERVAWRFRHLVSIVLLVGLGWLIVVSIDEAIRLDEHLEAARRLAHLPFGDAYDAPRYWSNGRF